MISLLKDVEAEMPGGEQAGKAENHTRARFDPRLKLIRGSLP